MAIAPNQGIMALPENQGMQAPRLSLADSYDAMQQGLMQARPDAYMEMQEALAEIRPELEELTDEQLALLIQAIQGLYGDPENYAARVQDLVKNRFIEDAEELPPEYNEEFIATLLMILVDIQRTRQGITSPMPQPEGGMPSEMPQGMMPPPQQFARGGIADAARIVASQGRNGDTMLAHITKDEARLLKALGGSGTINPQTGLPEFWPLLSRKRGIGKAVTRALNTPLGRIIGTVALGMVLGPAVGSVMSGFSSAAVAATTGALSSGLVTAAAGGDAKSILTSAAVGFLSAPGGPVSNYLGKYTGQFLTNPVVREAANASIIGTGVGLATGQNLKEALKAGLTEGVISGGMAYLSGAPKVDVDNAAQTAAKTATSDGMTLPDIDSKAIDLETQSVIDDFTGANKPTVKGPAAQKGTSQFRANGDGSYINLENGQYVSQEAAKGMGLGPSAYNPDLNAPDKNIFAPKVETIVGGRPNPRGDIDAQGTGAVGGRPNPQGRPSDAVMGGRPNPQGRPLAGIDTDVYPSGSLYQDPNTMVFDGYGPSPADAGGTTKPYVYPEIGTSLKKAATPGTMVEGLGDVFMPSAPTVEQVLDSSQYKSLVAKGMSPEAALKQATDSMSPGALRTYGPATVAGIGALAAAGGFKQDEPEPVNQEPTGSELLQRDPNKYLVQGLPGVQYGAQGNIIGGQPYGSPYTMADIRVPSSYQSPGLYAMGGIATLNQGGYPRRTGQISGPGTEKSDSIPAMLSDGEFVMTAKAVRGAGGGSRREGAKRMYALMHQLERNAARG